MLCNVSIFFFIITINFFLSIHDKYHLLSHLLMYFGSLRFKANWSLMSSFIWYKHCLLWLKQHFCIENRMMWLFWPFLWINLYSVQWPIFIVNHSFVYDLLIGNVCINLLTWETCQISNITAKVSSNIRQYFNSKVLLERQHDYWRAQHDIINWNFAHL